MFVGIGEIELHIPYAQSLKEKRRVVKSVVDNMRNKFPVSVAEVASNDLWQHAVLGVSLVSADKLFVERVFQRLTVFIDEMGICEIISFKKEIFSW